MSSFRQCFRRSGLPILLVLCLAALSVSYAYADEAQRPLAVQVIGDPDAAVTGRFAVGTGSVGSKALTVVGVIDFLGAGTVHNYFTQGAGNNMQINANVDEANVVGDASRSQWKLVLGSALDWFSIRRSPAGGTYNEDALFFIQGSTGRVGIATVDTSNGAAISFAFEARLHAETASGNAILGRTTVASGWVYGAGGETASSSGDGIYGLATATTGDAWGVDGRSMSSGGIGVYGWASASTGYTLGVEGDSGSPDGTGVFGWAFATTGSNYGVYGQSDSTDGTGVFGFASTSSGNNAGVIGSTASPGGYGVFGYAPTSGIAVYGLNADTAGWAGYFVGDLGISGTLYKGAGGFRIDHPLDPAHRYLNHSFVESPDMMDIYDGVATLDESGQAWVQFPEWFEALNQDFRYQLTPIGGSMPDLYIAQEVQGNRFLIGGGIPGMLVSWQVTGIRHDPYAEAHRIPVEEDKPPEEQGTYLHPELYGQDASFSLPQLQAPAVEHVRHGEQ